MQKNPAVEQNKNIRWPESPWNQSVIIDSTVTVSSHIQQSQQNHVNTVTAIQCGPAKVRPTYIFDGNI